MTSIKGKKWRIFPHESERIESLRRAAGVPAVLAQLLLCRGIDCPHAARSFLEAKLTGLRDPEELPGAADAARRLHEAVQAGRRIVIYGDYDLDGVSGTSLLWRCLKLLGADVGYYLPHRVDEGYGLNHQALETLARRGAELVVTVDCGITSVAEAETARRLGLELIVTDHHALADRVPEASAVVHPRLPGSAYPFGGLCGAGVAFKLAWAVSQQASEGKRVTQRMREFLLDAVSLAALGTVADVVPLVDENRILVRHGLDALKRRPSVGLQALMSVCQLDKKPSLTSEDVAFSLAPRLNAAGRLGQAQLAVELLTTDNAERAATLAEYINELNNSRQSLERSIYLAACKLAEREFDPVGDPALVLAKRGWHSGVIGIVASRLVEKYHRPVVLLALDDVGVKPATGSCRSVPGFDINAALSACNGHLHGHGGHAAAAGLQIDEANIDAFRAALFEHASQEISEEARIAELTIDAEAPLSAFTPDVMKHIARLEPFGEGNPRPLVCATDVRLAEPPKRIGGGDRHLQLKLVQHGTRMRAVAFGGGEWAEELEGIDGPLEVAFRPVINDFRGRRTVEAQVADWRVRRPAATG